MPYPGPNQSDVQSQYFILDGKRRELDEFDIKWVQTNCSLKKQEVF